MGEAPAERIEMKICTGVEFRDVILDVMFQLYKISGILMSLGVKIRPFPLSINHLGLTTVQRYRAACDHHRLRGSAALL